MFEPKPAYQALLGEQAVDLAVEVSRVNVLGHVVLALGREPASRAMLDSSALLSYPEVGVPTVGYPSQRPLRTLCGPSTLFMNSIMARNPIQRVIDATCGTARLLEGASTLVRARDANITPVQLQAIFPDLKRLKVGEIEAFTDISAKFFSGELRVSRSVFGKEMRSLSNPKDDGDTSGVSA